MPQLITCMGEMLIDFLPIVEQRHTVGFRMFPAGSLLNVAVSLARLGAPAAFAGKVSTDYFGRVLRSYAESERVDTRFLLDDPAPSTLAFVAMDGGEPSYAFYGDAAADTRLTPAELPAGLVSETAILHVGSISLLRGDTPRAVLAACQQARGRALLSFDPNIRPNLVHDAAAYRALIERLAGMADVFKISAADLEWLMPGVPPERAAEQIEALGPALVAVTRGGQGVLARLAGREYHVPAFAITVADTIGAGDTFNGGLLAALYELGARSRQALLALRDEQVYQALGSAAAAAAINCTRNGANPPQKHELQAFLSSSSAG
jgi:fructokinase